MQMAGRGPSIDSSLPFSYTPVVLRKKQLEDPDIGQIQKWKESGKRQFGPGVCASNDQTLLEFMGPIRGARWCAYV